MANTMILVCPHCSRQGQHEVGETEYNFSTTSRLRVLGTKEWDIWYRERWRDCVYCKRRFATGEIATRELNRIIDKTLLEAEQHRYLRETIVRSCEVSGRAAQIMLSQRIALLINDAFELWGSTLLTRPDLKSIKAQDLANADTTVLRTFIKLAAEGLNQLDAAAAAWAIFHYGLQGLDGIYVDEVQEDLDQRRVFKAIRRKSVSQKLRAARRHLQS